MKESRVQSIDLLRGIVILLMLLDHIRQYFHYDGFYFDPGDLEKTNLFVCITKWITHFCAPIFVLLAGTSAYFVGRRFNKIDLSKWLLKRGAWLIFLELTVIKFAWLSRFDFQNINVMVIWS